jgi:aminopeptidase
VARIRPVEFYRRQEVISTQQGIAWTLIPFPTAAWAARIFGEPDLERLREVISRSVRLDEPDPIAAWQAHAKELRERAELLTSSGYDGVRFRGPGTDLFVGLVPGAVWGSVPERKTAWRQRHCANMPTEEIATTPDCMRTSGVVTTTLPFADAGAYVTGARLRFEDGRVVDCSAEGGEAWLKQVIETDEGAAMLGEVALVPAENRLSALGMTFFSVLFDENVASHVALGQSYSEGVPGSEDLTTEERRAMGMCQSVVHFDFMIGSSEMDVFGVRKDGTEEPVMVGGRWSGGMRS